MKGARWFLWDFYAKIVLGTTAAVAVLVLVLGQAFHIEYLATYYYMLPMMAVIFVEVYAFSLTTSYRNMALSMGCRRTDFFRESQLAFAVNAAVCVLILWLAGNLPRLAGVGYAVFEDAAFANGAPLYAEPGACLYLLAVCLLLQPIGAAMGCLYDGHKVLSTVFLIAVMFLGMGGTVVLLFIGDGTIPESVTRIIGGAVLGTLAVLGAASEVYFYRSNRKAIVR